MSDQNEQLFERGVVGYKPAIACKGVIEEVGKDGKLFSITNPEEGKPKYVSVPVRIKGTSGSSRTAFVNFLFRPEWLVAGFSKKAEIVENAQLTDVERKSLSFVYDKNIISREGSSEVSTLEGISGIEGFGDLVRGIRNLSEITPTTVAEYLAAELPGTEVGYILTQATERVAEVDEEGETQYRTVRLDKYEVGDYFDPNDEKAVKRLVKRAEKYPDKFKVAFEAD